MRPDVVSYFNKKNLPIPRLIQRRPNGVTAGQVEEACCIVFDKILSGEICIKDIRIAQTVYFEAQKIEDSEYDKMWERVQHYDEIMADLIKQHKRLAKLALWLVIVCFIYLGDILYKLIGG